MKKASAGSIALFCCGALLLLGSGCGEKTLPKAAEWTKSTLRALARGMQEYEAEYEQWIHSAPAVSQNPTIIFDGSPAGDLILRVLSGENVNGLNPRELPFTSFKDFALEINNDGFWELKDAWKNPIKMAIDHDKNGTVESARNGTRVKIKAPFVIWSDGDPKTRTLSKKMSNYLTFIP